MSLQPSAMFSDVRQALRTLRSAPAFSLVVVLVLAVGIGATTIIFSVVNAVLLRPLPFPEAHRLVAIDTLTRGEPDDTSGPDLEDWRAGTRTLARVAGYSTPSVGLTAPGDPATVPCATVSGDFFDVLGATPIKGRALTAADDRPGAPKAAVLGAALWTSRFARDEAVVGRSITLDGESFTVVGVMPASFEFPLGADRVDVWVPLRTRSLSAQFAAQRGAAFLKVIGRLRDGVPVERAQAELSGIEAGLAKAYPGSNGIRTGVVVRPLQNKLTGEYRLALVVLMAAVGAVLLIACANVANLLLARGTARQKEMAIRAALGAGRLRLLRELLTESVLLSLAGGAAGTALASWGLAALLAASPVEIPRLHAVDIDRTVLLFALAISMATGIVFGLMPALTASRADAGDALKDAGRGTSGGRSLRTRQALVVAEVALSLVLLATAGLLGRTLLALRQVDPGFVAERAIGMQLSLPKARYPELADFVRFYRQMLVETSRIPGVTASGAATTLPMSGSDLGIGFSIEGQPATSDPSTRTSAAYFAVSPDYFRAMGIRLLRGRLFTERDDEHAANVIVIGETFAKRFWPGENPIGRRVTIGYNNTGPREVIGIVGDVQNLELRQKPALEMYTPYPQTPWPFLSIVARTQAEPITAAAGLRAALRRVDALQPPGEIRTLSEYVSQSVATPRFTAALFGAFASVALFLAAFGLFSVMAYSVAQRRREIGIRLALGASPSAVRSLVLSQAAWLGGLGVAAGVAAALAVSRVLGSLLFGISATDPATFAGVAVLLLGAVFAAAWLPARRATRVDPMVALRAD
jgi:putative ABC transport system permease protein